jgi:hypothetical protein
VSAPTLAVGPTNEPPPKTQHARPRKVHLNDATGTIACAVVCTHVGIAHAFLRPPNVAMAMGHGSWIIPHVIMPPCVVQRTALSSSLA